MKRMWTVTVVLILLVALVFSGCQRINDALDRYYAMMYMGTAVSFENMEYIRPDMNAYRKCLAEALAQAQTATDAEVLMESVYALYLNFYDFSTNSSLAQIHYFKDMTDIFWEKEYSWCMEQSAEVSAGMDKLLYALADCDLREELEQEDFFGEGFFDMYEGDSLWDETFTALMEEEAALVDAYYDLSAQAAEVTYYSEEYFTGVGLQIEEVFLELIRVRQEMAEYAGYDSYPEFAYEFHHYRDYTPQQAQRYVDQICTELAPMYLELDDSVWDPLYEACSQEQMLEYVGQCAQNMGGVAADAFSTMEELKLYDITYSPNKYDASFEIFLISYYSPFVFVNPMGNARDQLTLAHEFGHFCNDYAVTGSGVGVDVAEVFSQGLEYLSLCYCADTEALTRMKLADSLSVFVEQALYASFENQVYLLEDPTVEDVRALYGEIHEGFGFGDLGRDYRDYTLVPHFFMSPMYVISYVVSNDGAMQIYEKELESTGAGKQLWEDSLYSMELGYMAFAEEAGLESPFAEGRVEELRKIFEEKLK